MLRGWGGRRFRYDRNINLLAPKQKNSLFELLGMEARRYASWLNRIKGSHPFPTLEIPGVKFNVVADDVLQ